MFVDLVQSIRYQDTFTHLYKLVPYTNVLKCSSGKKKLVNFVFLDHYKTCVENNYSFESL